MTTSNDKTESEVFDVILFSTRSKREMRTRTTVRLSRSDAIRNNGLLVRKDKVE
ncbi:hypothetical protein ALC60_14546 [Trachymyrmex zeteki]|uniref:Uncharacterized protein n=1 Tax=Mycetomoellerius zeteki TaxID=64791 RepID=A0A151WF18_9HYME|nr:hypothetical protein ALC60_14546 [Trachymyrmex zeteki]